MTDNRIYRVSLLFRLIDPDAFKVALLLLESDGVAIYSDNTIEENIELVVTHLDLIARGTRQKVGWNSVGLERVSG